MTFYNIKKIIWNIIIIFSIIMSVCVIEERIFLKNSSDKIISLNDGWKVSIDGKTESDLVSLPTKIKDSNENKNVTLSRKIDSIGIKNPVMLIRTELQSVNIYLDDKLVYQCKKSDKQLFGKEPESNWLFVELPEDYAGKNMKVEYSSSYAMSSDYYHSILLGNRTDLFSKILQDNGNKFIGAIILFSIGLLLAVIYYGLMHANDRYKKIFYLALIDLAASVWVALDADIIELFIHEGFPRGEVKIISLVILLILFIEFLKSVFSNKYSNVLNVLQCNIIVYLIVASFLHFNNKIHYIDSIIVFHILCLSVFIVFLIIFIKENIRIINKHKYIVIPIILVGISVLVDIANYYEVRNKYVVHYSEYSIIVFTLVFSYYVGKDFLVMYNHEVKSEIYKELAYTDPLTKLYNKVAFDERMTLINMDIKKYYGSPIFVFDINNTKRLNDTVGHNKGNEFIKENAKILIDIFKQYGDIFRVGGDEFVFIGKKDTPIDECEEKLAQYVEIAIPEYKIFFTGISYGYDIINEKYKSVYEVQASADRNMRKLKNRLRFSNIR